jgi:formate dehydrogenase subunit delta
MDDDKLIRAANQIATFFAAYPREEAVAGIADHMQKFWEPRLRRRFAELMEAGVGGVEPLVLDAWPRVRV